MDFEYMFHQAGFTTAYELLVLGCIALAGVAGRDEQYRKFIDGAATCIVTFGPMALLIYMLYSVSRLS